MFSGSSVAVVTPMHPDGAIDFDAWQRLLEFHVSGGTAAVVVGGTTGESATITDAELRQLVIAARDVARGRVAIIAGAGVSSTAMTVERVRWLGDLNIDGLLVVTPAYVKPTQEGLFQHYSAVAAVAKVPVVLYNVPGRTGVDMVPATVARLATLPKIVAIKEAVPGAARVRDIRSLAPTFTVLSGDDATCREAVLAGARGVISVTANVAPNGMREMIAAALAGDAGRAAALDAPLAGLHEALFVEGNPIPVKWALQRMGMISAGIRLPMTPLAEPLQGRVAAAMDAAGLKHAFRGS
ncbi:MAG: 4-hydroxy-tetrahydrodipicolinate synthase [Gammaproteobacteria bacterium]|nr:4-hydroxy-tetrahydrodipicolinate synthase [Gammaproteobacteria bacterium]